MFAKNYCWNTDVSFYKFVRTNKVYYYVNLFNKFPRPLKSCIDECNTIEIKHFFLHGPNFIELLSTRICLSWNFFLDKNKITNQISIFCILFVTGIQLLFAYPENHVNIWLLILFLSRKKFLDLLSNFLCLASLWNWAQNTPEARHCCYSAVR